MYFVELDCLLMKNHLMKNYSIKSCLLMRNIDEKTNEKSNEKKNDSEESHMDI